MNHKLPILARFFLVLIPTCASLARAQDNPPPHGTNITTIIAPYPNTTALQKP